MDKLVEILIELWNTVIQASYKKGILCSERHLQAEIYQHFTNRTDTSEYQMWVEPMLELYYKKAENGKFKPDLVITQDLQVICFIELKYIPWRNVNFQYDIDKLAMYQNDNLNKIFPLRTEPITGNWSVVHKYTIAPDVLTVFAVIAKYEAWAHGPDSYYEEILGKPFPLKNYLILKGKIGDKNNPVDFGYRINQNRDNKTEIN